VTVPQPEELIPISALLDLTGRQAVITGGAQGMGLAIAMRLAEAGATIHAADINIGRANESIIKLPTVAIPHQAYEVDVRSLASIKKLAEKLKGDCGHIDIWVNCAGIFTAQPLRSMTEAQWDDMIDINLKGTFLCGQAAAELMSNGGVIINVASTSAHRGRPLLAHYCASKHGVEGLTKSMALEFGPLGIRVVSVSPTLTRTDGLRARQLSGDETGRAEVAELEKKVADSIPLGRIGEPDDTAKVVLFLASDLAGLVSGSTVLIDGGQLAY
jgi:NAD(P)-dependent dehydrogenase (short-subunit alcohol dehydrogenase family)